MYDPSSSYMAGILPGDGTVDFYLRVGSVVTSETCLVDLGAGRGAWSVDDPMPLRRSIRTMKGRAREVVGIDVDPAVLANRSVDRAALIENDRFPLADAFADVIVADYVLEHVEDVSAFAAEVDRVLKPGGWFCARTPSRWHYVSVVSRLSGDGLGPKLLHRSQPRRKTVDVFSTYYRLNTLGDIHSAFPTYESRSFMFRGNPAYYFGRRSLYRLMGFVHRVLPAGFSGNIFAFLRKPPAA